MSLKRSILIAPLGLLSLTVLSGAFLMSSYSYATDDSAVDNVSINVPVSCTMSGTGMNSHNANIVNGTYQADIGTTTVKVFCNDSAGFAIYANGYTSNELGKNTLVGSSTSSEIITGTATSTPNPDVSNWAMKLTAPTSPTPTYPLTLDNSFGSYHSVPSEYTKVAHRDSATDIGTNAEGATLTTTYAAYISKTQSADSYAGQVIYTLVHPANEIPTQPVACPGGKICYNSNTATTIGQMGQQSASNNTSVTLWAPNFKRDGYGFAGWNTEYDYSGNFYGPNQTITTPSDVSTNGLSLYAVWIKSAGSLQNWDGCGSLAQGATTALTDERDGNTYAVAKLADNKCWMIENLRLADKDNRNNNVNLSSANTHNPSLPFINYNGIADKTQSNHLSQPYDPYTLAWCSEHSSDCYDQSMLATNNTTLYINNTSSNYSASNYVYSYGNYYNWYSATAGHGTYNKSSGNTAGDICPTGWHLPTGRSSGDFGLLDIALGGPGSGTSSSTTPTGSTMSGLWRSFPNNFTYSGSVMGSFIGSRNGGADYWTSSANGNDNAINLIIINGNVSPGTAGNYKYQGKSVRCVHGI